MAMLQLGSGQQKKPQLGIVPPLQKTPEYKPPTAPNMGIPSGIGNAATFAGGVAQGIVPQYKPPTTATGSTQGLSASAIGGATQGVVPKLNTAGSAQKPANNFSKNTGGGVVPSLGYGGANYGSSAQDNFAIDSNKYKLENTPGYKESEIERTKKTIADRKAVGLDTSAQEKYLTVNLGQNAWSEETPIDPNVGLPPPVDYKALAEAEFAAKLAESRSRADAEKAALKGAWDTSNQTIRDNRTLDNLFFQRNNSPFSGRTTYREAALGREREQQDAASLNQFNSSVAGIEQGYTDAQTEIEAQIAARAYTLEQEAIAKAQADAELTGLYNGSPTLSAQDQTFNQNLETQKLEQDKLKYGDDVAYRNARDKIADTKDKRDFDEDVRQFGLDDAWRKYQEKQVAGRSAKSGSSGGSSKTPSSNTEIPAKESANNAGEIRSEIINEKLSRTDALKYLQANQDVLSNADYNKLMTYINSLK